MAKNPDGKKKAKVKNSERIAARVAAKRAERASKRQTGTNRRHGLAFNPHKVSQQSNQVLLTVFNTRQPGWQFAEKELERRGQLVAA